MDHIDLNFPINHNSKDLHLIIDLDHTYYMIYVGFGSISSSRGVYKKMITLEIELDKDLMIY